MAQHNELGKWGEDIAVAFLREKGYTIRERDWKFGQRDIDIIALTPDHITCVFVEVKTRRSDDIVLPVDAVDFKKMKFIGSAADQYVKQNNIQEELRFDIISVVGVSQENMTIDHLEDAFNPLLL